MGSNISRIRKQHLCVLANFHADFFHILAKGLALATNTAFSLQTTAASIVNSLLFYERNELLPPLFNSDGSSLSSARKPKLVNF